MSLVLLDRDGVLNFESYAYIKTPDEWIPIPGALEAVARLTQAGLKTAIVSNQSGLDRGYYDETILAAIHAKIQACLAAVGGHIDAIYYCPHHPDKNCSCRKPKPELLLRAAANFNCDITQTPFVGDRESDVEAAKAAGAIPYFLSNTAKDLENVTVCADLNEVVTIILNHRS